MSETRPTKGGRTVELSVAVELRDAGDERPQSRVYAFSSRGRPLGAAAPDVKGVATMRVRASQEAEELRVLVGPEVAPAGEVEGQPRIGELLRRGAQELRLRVDPQVERVSGRIAILPEHWHCWLLGLYSVRGSVVKRIGGTDLPICDATVEIYEVDPIYVLIPRLPDLVIERIREIILFPPPPPPPPFEPIRGIPTPRPPLPFAEPLMKRVQADAAPQAEVPASLRFVAQTANTDQLRLALIDHAAIIRHLLCLIDPPLVTMQLVATVETDRCGEFRALISRGCSSDKPDLYFKVKQRVFPFLPPFTIYAPLPVPCHTHWNYVSGTEVTLRVTHPLAIACPPCPKDNIPELGVVVEAIGNVLLDGIFGTSPSDPVPVSAANRGLLHDGRPWGGTLRLRLDFDPALRDNNIRYYRVRWRRGTSGDFADLTDPIVHHYRDYAAEPPVDHEYPLGPQTVGGTAHLYEIKPQMAPGPLSSWIVKDLFEDTIHAKFPTTRADIAPGIPHTSPGPDNAGKYQLEITLFDGAGNPVDLAATGAAFYTGTAGDPHPAASLGLVVGNSFIMTLHVDNNPCFAAINPPVDQNGDPAGLECGVIEYATDGAGNKLGTVTMSYTAAHRNGFAKYDFRLVRGAFSLTLPGFMGTPGLPVTDQQVPSGTGTFSHTQPVAALLGSCPVAGFSQNLYVDAMATDGLGSELGYDAAAVFAFALAPEGAGA